MFIRFRQRQGQSVIGQYAITFFVVIAMISVMTIYVRRGIQGRIYAAKKHMIETIRAGATGVAIPDQYEPYYANKTSDKLLTQDNGSGLKQGKYSQTTDEKTKVFSVIVLIFFIVNLGAFAIRYYDEKVLHRGIVVRKDVECKYEPIDKSTTFYRLQEGDLVAVIKTSSRC